MTANSAVPRSKTIIFVLRGIPEERRKKANAKVSAIIEVLLTVRMRITAKKVAKPAQYHRSRPACPRAFHQK
jgi:hypothetical protein